MRQIRARYLFNQKTVLANELQLWLTGREVWRTGIMQIHLGGIKEIEEQGQ